MMSLAQFLPVFFFGMAMAGILFSIGMLMWPDRQVDSAMVDRGLAVLNESRTAQEGPMQGADRLLIEEIIRAALQEPCP